MSELLFTPAAILDLLSKIDELKDIDVGVSELLDNQIQVTVGESVYIVSGEGATTIQVNPDTLEVIEDVNMDTYQQLSDSGEVELQDNPEAVEGGIIKEFAKTLFVGGLVRLTAKMLRK